MVAIAQVPPCQPRYFREFRWLHAMEPARREYRRRYGDRRNPRIVTANPTYGTTEQPLSTGGHGYKYSLAFPANTLLLDQRSGHLGNYCQDPTFSTTFEQYCELHVSTYTLPGTGGDHFLRDEDRACYLDGGNNTFFGAILEDLCLACNRRKVSLYRQHKAEFQLHQRTDGGAEPTGCTINAQGDNVPFTIYGGGAIGMQSQSDREPSVARFRYAIADG